MSFILFVLLRFVGFVFIIFEITSSLILCFFAVIVAASSLAIVVVALLDCTGWGFIFTITCDAPAFRICG